MNISAVVDDLNDLHPILACDNLFVLEVLNRTAELCLYIIFDMCT